MKILDIISLANRSCSGELQLGDKVVVNNKLFTFYSRGICTIMGIEQDWFRLQVDIKNEGTFIGYFRKEHFRKI